MVLEAPRGMDDLLPREMALKRMIEEAIREVFKLYGYLEVETPTIEYYELFAAKSGEEIRERMFDFKDKAGRRLVLRPEVTASIARLVSTKLKMAAPPLRLGYIADCYRYDEPQWGRRRRFWQGGFELLGSSSPLADAEIMQVSYEVFMKIGLKDHYFKVGHVGIMRTLLESYGADERVQDRILTMLDRGMKDEAISLMKQVGVNDDGIDAVKRLMEIGGEDLKKVFSKASDILSSWDRSRRCLENLIEIIELAREGGVESRIIVSPALARGLEYYTGFIFEQGVPDLQISLNGGGRYDKLVELFGGKPTPAVGCAIGISRIMQYMLDKELKVPEPMRPKTLLVGIPNVSKSYLIKVSKVLRELEIPIELELSGKRLPKAIDYALKNGMRFLVIVGEREEVEERIAIRDLEAREQVEIPLSEHSKIKEVLSRS